MKNQPATQETQEKRGGFQGPEEPLEQQLTTQPSLLAWEIPWTEGYGPWGCKKSDTTEHMCAHTRTHAHTHPLSADNEAKP